MTAIVVNTKLLKGGSEVRKISGLLVIIFILFYLSGAFAADKYIIDAEHSTIGFAATHMEVSVVRGEFTDYKGEVLFDEKNIDDLRIDIVIKAKNIDTRLKARDDHLRSADFFDVQNYPVIIFKSKKILKRNTGYEIIGDLTMHGVTREVSGQVVIRGPVKTSYGKQLIGISGEAIINRLDYGISWNAKMPGGGLAVGDEVKILIDVEAFKE